MWALGHQSAGPSVIAPQLRQRTPLKGEFLTERLIVSKGLPPIQIVKRGRIPQAPLGLSNKTMYRVLQPSPARTQPISDLPPSMRDAPCQGSRNAELYGKFSTSSQNYRQSRGRFSGGSLDG
jgi:hypothetical protein